MFRPKIHSIHMQGDSEKRDAMEGGASIKESSQKVRGRLRGEKDGGRLTGEGAGTRYCINIPYIHDRY